MRPHPNCPRTIKVSYCRLRRLISQVLLVHRDLERIKGVSPAVNRRCIIDTIKSTAISQSKRPVGNWHGICVSLIRSRLDSSIESRRLDAIHDPANHDVHVVLRVWARLERVGTVGEGNGGGGCELDLLCGEAEGMAKGMAGLEGEEDRGLKWEKEVLGGRRFWGRIMVRFSHCLDWSPWSPKFVSRCVKQYLESSPYREIL